MIIKLHYTKTANGKVIDNLKLSLRYSHVKKNTNSPCVNHIYTLPAKPWFIIQKNRIRLIFFFFRKHFGRKDDESEEIKKTHMKISDSLHDL